LYKINIFNIVNPKIKVLQKNNEKELKEMNNVKDDIKSKNKKSKEGRNENNSKSENRRNKKNFKDQNNEETDKVFKPKNPHPKTPKYFYDQFELIKTMRDNARAPVDDMGVECTVQSNTDRPTFKFQTLVSLILSAQTNDKTTFAIMRKLLDFGLTVDNISGLTEAKLIELIYGVNFHNNKARSILNVCIFK